MINILPWWRERLVKRFPLCDALKQEPVNFKSRDGIGPNGWPARVARSALFLDYRVWADDQAKAQWPDLDVDGRAKMIANELVFFSTMKPFLYPGNKRQMVKNYHIKQQVQVEGRWITIKKRRWFIRLAAFEVHRDVFVQGTGLEVK